MAELRSQQVESELQPQLAQAESDVRTLRDMNTYISDTVVVIGRSVQSFFLFHFFVITYCFVLLASLLWLLLLSLSLVYPYC